MLDALGSLIGGAASVVRAVSDRKAARRQTEVRGLYLAPYKRGGSVRKRKARGKKKTSWKETLETLKIPLFGITTNK